LVLSKSSSRVVFFSELKLSPPNSSPCSSEIALAFRILSSE
jgi:hypothetical protein